MAGKTRRGPFSLVTSVNRRVIDKFLEESLGSLTSTLASLQTYPERDRPDWMVKNIEYYKHAVAGVKWIKSMNLKRGKAVKHGCPRTKSIVAGSARKSRSKVRA